MNPQDINFGGYFNPQGYLQNLQATTAMPAPAMGAVASPAGFGAASGGLGFNMDTAKLALGGLQTVGNLWNAFQANKLARETFGYQKKVTDNNIANQIQSYNTTLQDRIRARTFTEGGTQESADAYVAQHSLRRQY